MSLKERAAEVLGEWQERLQEGTAPDCAEMLREHPELEAELREGIAAMQLLDQLLEGGSELSGPTPRRLGEFEILREIGRGGMGVVYEAEQASMRRRVALKALYPRIGRSERAVERFQREARAAGKAHHTNIVPVHGLGREGGVWFYAMELVEGTSLARVLEDMRKLGGLPGGPGVDPLTTPSVTPPSSGLTPQTGVGYFHRVATMFAEVAEALEAAHQVGVIHRDVKPSNLILADDGRLKLIDFGLAWMRGEESLVTASGERLGTPLYMSPELARGEKVDARSDVYSLATTLYEVLALRPPHRGENAHEIVHRILTREPPPLRRVNPRVPRDLETIVHKALEKEPARRFATAAAFGRDLRSFAGGEGIRARPVGPVGRLWRRAKRHRVASSLIVTVVVLLALGAGLWVRAEQHAARERELAYRELCGQAEIALARTAEEPAAAELRLAPPSPARRLFAEAITVDPERPEAWVGRALAAGSTLEQSLADLEEARKRGLDARSYHLARAWFLGTAGMEHEAEEERRLAAKAPGGSALADFLEGRRLMAAGRPEEALPHLDRAIRDVPQESLHRYLALMVRSGARRRLGDSEGALEDLTLLKVLSGDSSAVRVRIASVWRQLGLGERAEELFSSVLEEVVRARLRDEWHLFLDGLSLGTDRDWLDIATARALEAHPDSLELMLRRLGVLHSQDVTPAAMELCRRILERDPECFRALELQALGLLGSGRPEEALAAIEKAIALAPTEPALHNTRGMALMNLRRFEEAEGAFREVVRLDPASALGWSNLAGVLSLERRLEEVVTAAHKALELQPEHANTHFLLGVALHDLGHIEEAIAAFDRAFALGADSPHAHAQYGLALSDAGRPDEGLVLIDKAIALADVLRSGAKPLDPNLSMLADPKALVGFRTGRATVLLRLDRSEEAVAEAQACVDLAPEWPKAREVLDQARRSHTWKLFMTGRIEEALGQQLCLVPTGPANAVDHMRHALYLAWLDRFDEAQGAYERGLAAGLSSEEARRPAIEFLLLAGKPEAAAALARRAFAADGLRFAVPYLRALRARGELAEAEDFAAGLIDEEYAAERDPLELAWLCAVARAPDRARAALTRVVRPWHPFAAYERARIHALLGESDAAVQWLVKARDLGFRWPSRAAPDPDFSTQKEDLRYESLMESVIRTGP